MDRPEGIVTRVEGSKVRVMVRRHEACGSCTCSEGGCSLDDPASKLEVDAEAKPELALRRGDWVELESRHFRRAVFLAYGFPLLAFVLPLVLLSWRMPELGDLALAGSAFASLALALVALRLLLPWINRSGGPGIEVVAVTRRYEPGPRG